MAGSYEPVYDFTPRGDSDQHRHLPRLVKVFAVFVRVYAYHRDENSQPFSIRKICRLTPKWRKTIFKSLIKGLKSQNINRNQSVYA